MMKLGRFFGDAFEFRKVILFCVNDMDTPAFPEQYPDIRIVPIDKSNVSRVLDIRKEEELRTFKTFLRKGYYGVFAEYKGRIVGHHWAQINRTSKNILSATHMLLPPRTALTFYAYVAEEMRGKRIHASMKRELCCNLFAEGVRRVIADVDCHNYSSLKGNRRLNITELGGMYICGFFEILYIFWCQQQLNIFVRSNRFIYLWRKVFCRRELLGH